MKRAIGIGIVCISILCFGSAFLPWVHVSATLGSDENEGIEDPPELTIVVSPLRRVVGMKPVDVSGWTKHFESKGEVHATPPGKPSLQYGMFFLLPIVLLVIGVVCVKGKTSEWVRLTRWILLVGIVGAVLTFQRGVRDHLELDIQADLGIQATITYQTTVWAWLTLLAYLVTMVAASLVLMGWMRNRVRSHHQQD
jgi:hypothetical protein